MGLDCIYRSMKISAQSDQPGGPYSADVCLVVRSALLIGNSLWIGAQAAPGHYAAHSGKVKLYVQKRRPQPTC